MTDRHFLGPGDRLNECGPIGVAAPIAPLPLGIAAGLFFGKQLGIFGAV